MLISGGDQVKAGSERKSPRNAGHQVLGVIPSQRVENLLYEWANLPIRVRYASDRRRAHPAYERVISRYPEVFSFQTKGQCYDVLETVREGLQRIWRTTDLRQRDWDIFNMRNQYAHAMAREETGGITDLFARGGNEVLIVLPKLTPFEAAMIHLQNELSRRMLHCPNPECAAPFFFRTEKSQKACSPECADWLRRQSKLRWYHESENSPKNRKK